MASGFAYLLSHWPILPNRVLRF